MVEFGVVGLERAWSPPTGFLRTTGGPCRRCAVTASEVPWEPWGKSRVHGESDRMGRGRVHRRAGSRAGTSGALEDRGGGLPNATEVSSAAGSWVLKAGAGGRRLVRAAGKRRAQNEVSRLDRTPPRSSDGASWDKERCVATERCRMFSDRTRLYLK